ncbi:hypothetical protein PoB_004108800 [Plakobranchus ocellatus]|uniref:Uncharacterized protein n=1 Tax=Plakobranchus ocellatus TaxID=259542 RepID=A0AAV4B653_9GAST|nr:hypothetical protein PoB_004108800 [Plakobranchus ocellatus]
MGPCRSQGRFAIHCATDILGSTQSHKQVLFLSTVSPKGDLRLSGLPSGQGTGGGAPIRNRRLPADRWAGSISTVCRVDIRNI